MKAAKNNLWPAAGADDEAAGQRDFNLISKANTITNISDGNRVRLKHFKINIDKFGKFGKCKSFSTTSATCWGTLNKLTINQLERFE